MTILDRLRSMGDRMRGGGEQQEATTPKSPKSPTETWRFTDPA